jgi:hypothetical protein
MSDDRRSGSETVSSGLRTIGAPERTISFLVAQRLPIFPAPVGSRTTRTKAGRDWNSHRNSQDCVTSMWTEHPQHSRPGCSSAVWWVGAAFASPAVNIREQFARYAHPTSGPRRTGLLNKIEVPSAPSAGGCRCCNCGQAIGPVWPPGSAVLELAP